MAAAAVAPVDLLPTAGTLGSEVAPARMPTIVGGVIPVDPPIGAWGIVATERLP